MASFAEKMALCARGFHASAAPGPDSPVPDRFEEEDEAVEAFARALHFEAHQDMLRPIEFPPKPLMQGIDLETAHPGVLESKQGSDLLLTRMEAGGEVPTAVQYRRNRPPPPSAPPPTALPSSSAPPPAPEQIQKALEMAEKQEVSALARDRKRAHKKRERAAVGASSSAAAHDDDADEGAPTPKKATPPKPKKEESSSVPKKRKSPQPVDESALDLEINAALAPIDFTSRRVTPKCARGMHIYASPVPHDRHLRALMACGAHPELLPTLLRGEPKSNPRLRLVEGPPGTGKTTRLLADVHAFLEEFPEKRCVVCAPTNAAVADLFARALRLGVVGHLGLSKESIPVGVPRVQLLEAHAARVLFCTVSGRNGPRLLNERVHAVFLEEAGLCPEALVWGLLRPEVELLQMVGDTRQLPALVSEEGRRLRHDRSMLERLRALGVHTEELHEQRRMHPEILRFPNEAFYDGALRTPEDRVNGSVRGVPPYELVTVEGEEERVGTSWKNVTEAECAVREAEALMEHFEDVVVLVPYVAMREAVLALSQVVRVSTVDAFQGKEADAVVLCVVRTGELGFWEEPRRLTVALTRARHAFRLLGHWSRFQTPPLSDLLHDAVVRRVLRTSTTA